jgi:O-acetyl-ADP-ribose deacetylase (regulator of RNase III)
VNVRYVTGDLFEQRTEALAHGVNCVGAMGRGIAVEFKRRWPAMYREYFQRCADGRLVPGTVFAYDLPPVDGRPWLTVFNLGTQASWRTPALLPAIESSVAEMLHLARDHGLGSVAMPRIGCGLGGLAWDDVRRLVERAAARFADDEIDLVVVTLPEAP